MASSDTAYSGSVPENYDRYLGPLLFEPFARDLVSRIGSQTPPDANAPASPDALPETDTLRGADALPETDTLRGADALRDVLEIACGTGRLTRHLRSSIPANTRLAALDLNPDMIAIARLRLPDLYIQWQTGDAQALPYRDGSFDLVICQFGIMFVPDKAKALAEFFRVLRPGGRLLFNTWNTIVTNEVVYVASETINQFFPDQPPAFYRSPFSFYDEGLIRSLLLGAGFSDIDTTLRKIMGSSPSAADAATGLVEGSPVIGFIMEKAPELLPRIRESVKKEIASRFGDKPLQSTLEAWVAGARKK